MKTLKRISLYFLVLVLVVLSVAAIYISRLSKRGLPDYASTIRIEGLEKTVKVYRDVHGIPHIYATSEHDLYMATGYVMAQDRLWQMDLLRRVTLGRLSEIFGDSFMETDLLLRSLRYSKKSEQLLKTSPKETIMILEAFAKGVNRYIEHNKGNYPLEFSILGYEPEKWEPLHSLNLIGYMAWDLKSGWGELVLEKIRAKVDSAHFTGLLPDSENQNSVVFDSCQNELLSSNRLTELDRLDKLGLDVFSGSNNWAVSGKKSTTGKPLLANDMHLSYNIPGTWIEMHQVVEGSLNVSGLALPGQPFIVVGHNDSIAWGMTNTYVDNLDYYEEKINPNDTNQYLFNGKWERFDIHQEVIVSKGGAKHNFIYRTNHRGPVVSRAKKISDRVLTIRWTGDVESNELYCIYKVNRARNWQEFKDAFITFRALGQNIADVRGNIGLYCCAGVPIRKRDKIYAVLPGCTDEYDWQGMVPFEELPHLYNPSCGYVSSANNPTAYDSYPYHIGTWYSLPYRIDRIREMLKAKEKLSLKDFERMQNDQHSKFAELFLNKLLPYLNNGSNWSETERTAIQILKNWDYNMSSDAAAPALLDKWAYNLTIFAFKDEMGEDLFKSFLQVGNIPRQALFNLLKNPNSPWIDNIETEKKETFSDIALGSFRETIKAFEKDCGNDTMKWHWGNFHQLTLAHPLSKVRVLDKIFKLNRGPYKVGGSYHTIAPYTYPFFEPGNVNHGASHRSIYDIGDWDSSVSVIPTGISGISSSKFYCDQTSLYINGEYHEDYYSTENVKQNARYTNTFLP